MSKEKKDTLIIKLVLGVVLGLLGGLYANSSTINIIQTLKHVLGQVISFTVPLIILGFIAPAITNNESQCK